MRCTAHGTTNCLHSACRRERDRRTVVEDTTTGGLADPISPLHQAAYGSSYYGSTSDTSSPSSCDTSSSSGSSSSSSDSGSSSGSCD